MDKILKEAFDKLVALEEGKYPDMNAFTNGAIREDSLEAHDEQIAAVGQLIADRTEDENSPSKLRTDAFVDIINKMGLPLTKETLMDLKEKGTLDSVLQDVNPDEVSFKGQMDIDPTQMTVDKARATVDKMAKRQAKKGINK